MREGALDETGRKRLDDRYAPRADVISKPLLVSNQTLSAQEVVSTSVPHAIPPFSPINLRSDRTDIVPIPISKTGSMVRRPMPVEPASVEPMISFLMALSARLIMGLPNRAKMREVGLSQLCSFLASGHSCALAKSPNSQKAMECNCYN